MPGQKAAEEQRRDEILAAAYRVATSRGLGGLTVRGVAAEAGLSHGLVHFHFRSKDALVGALLDQVLAGATALREGADVTGIASPVERLAALLHQEMLRLTGDAGRIRLLFDFWLAGTRHMRLRARLRNDLKQYREAFLPAAQAAIAAEAGRFQGVTAEALASAAVAFLRGCAVQSVVDPEFDVERAAGAARALIVGGVGAV
jgi:AcrR family transcriptional regulator